MTPQDEELFWKSPKCFGHGSKRKIKSLITKIIWTRPYRLDLFRIYRSTAIVYDRNHYFGLGLIPKPKPKLADTFGRYRNYNETTF
jgi:hypothetical protein